MSDMIERVARALFADRVRTARRWDTTPERLEAALPATVDIGWPDAVPQARLAIEAMREPAQAMLEAVKPWPAHWPRQELEAQQGARWAAYATDQWSARQQWEEMIDAALAVPQTVEKTAGTRRG